VQASDLIHDPGLINVDFADVRTYHEQHGRGADGHRTPRARLGRWWLAAVETRCSRTCRSTGRRNLDQHHRGANMTLVEVNQACSSSRRRRTRMRTSLRQRDRRRHGRRSQITVIAPASPRGRAQDRGWTRRGGARADAGMLAMPQATSRQPEHAAAPNGPGDRRRQRRPRPGPARHTGAAARAEKPCALSWDELRQLTGGATKTRLDIPTFRAMGSKPAKTAQLSCCPR